MTEVPGTMDFIRSLVGSFWMVSRLAGITHRDTRDAMAFGCKSASQSNQNMRIKNKSQHPWTNHGSRAMLRQPPLQRNMVFQRLNCSKDSTSIIVSVSVGADQRKTQGGSPTGQIS